jgi:hypothetical protein
MYFLEFPSHSAQTPYGDDWFHGSFPFQWKHEHIHHESFDWLLVSSQHPLHNHHQRSWDEDVDYEYWSSNHNAHVTLSIINSLHNKCMNLIHLPEKYHISILYDAADTFIIGQGWEVLSVHNTRRANVVGYDHEAVVKRNLPIVSAITAFDLLDGISVILIVHEAIYNDTSNHSLLSEFQLRYLGVNIESIWRKHGRTQKMVIQDVGRSFLTPLELAGFMIHFKHRFPTAEDVNSLNNIAWPKITLHGIRHHFLIKLQTVLSTSRW